MSKYPQSTWFSRDPIGQDLKNTGKNGLTVGNDAGNFIV